MNTAKTTQSAADIISLVDHALKTSEKIVGSIEKAAQLPFITIFTRRITENCFQRAWYSKSGACQILAHIIDEFPLTWLHNNDYVIFSSLMFIIRDLCDEVSFGAVQDAKSCIGKLLDRLTGKAKRENETTKPLCCRILADLVKEIIAPSTTVRRFAHATLDKCAADMGCTVVQLIEQQQREKADILPICSKNGKMYLKSIPAQIGILDGIAEEIFSLALGW